MRVWRQLAIVAALGALCAGGFVAYSGYFSGNAAETEETRGPRQTTVEVDTVKLASLNETVEAVGSTRARASVNISPLASGTVLSVSFAPGQAVQAGEVLARLDDDIQRADHLEAQAVLKQQQQAVARLRQLRNRKAVATTTLEQAVADLAVAQAAEQRAKRRLEDRTIRAPFAGIVGLTDVEVGAQVDDETILTRVDDLSEVEIAFSLPEDLFGSVGTGQRISAQSAAFLDRVFAGDVTAVDSRIDPIGRSFKLRATIPNPDGLLPAGMFMAIVVNLTEAEALVVPEEALVVQAAQTYVFVADGGKAVRQAVVTGLRRDGLVAITDGVTLGQQVITRGLQRVRDGAPIKILEQAVGTNAPPPGSRS